MAELAFLDTNVLLYSVSEVEAEAAKRDIAVALLQRDDGALSVQVLHEFFHQATRPTRHRHLQPAYAWALMATWRRFPVQELTLHVLENAYTTLRRTRYSIWDSLVIAAAQALGCRILFTEDLEDGRIIDGLRIINPFRESAILP